MIFSSPKIDQRSYDQIVQQLSGLAEYYTAEWLPVDEQLAGKILAEAVVVVSETVAEDGATTAETITFAADRRLVLEVTEKTDLAIATLQQAGIKQVLVKRWSPKGMDLGQALIRIFGNMVTTVGDRLNLVPEKNFLSFLDLIGAQLAPPEAALVPITFLLADGTNSDTFAPENTPVAAPPTEDQAEEVVFETDRPLVLTPAQLQTVWVQDPRHHLYSDRLPEATGHIDAPYAAFTGTQAIAHHLYVSCPEIFEIAGLASITLDLDCVSRPEALALRTLPTWQRWLGDRWVDQTPEIGEVPTREHTFPVTFTDLEPFPASGFRGKTARWLRAHLALPPENPPRIDHIGSRASFLRPELLPDLAFHNETSLNLTKDFYPFGEESSPEDKFYLQLHQDSVYPNGEVTLHITLNVLPNLPENAVTIIWELGNGLAWQPLVWVNKPEQQTNPQFRGRTNFTATFQLPALPQLSTVEGEVGYWIRARISQGFFGVIPAARQYPIFDELTIVTKSNSTTSIEVDSLDILQVGDVIRLYPMATTNSNPYPEERRIASLNAATKTVTLDRATAQTFATGTRVLRKTIASETATPIHDPPQVKFCKLSYAFTLAHQATIYAENDFGVATGQPFQTWLARSAQIGDRYLDLDTVENLDVGEWVTTPDGDYQIIAMIPAQNRVLLKTALEKYTPKYSEIRRDFRPFVGVGEAEPSLYLGFDRPFSNNTTSLYFQIDPPDPDTEPDFSVANPQLIWEYSSPRGWQRLGVQDETRSFSQRGIVQFIAPADFTLWRLRDRLQAWLRVRWVEGEFPMPPRLRRILTNTTWAQQATCLKNEILGSSNNNAHQIFYTRQTPVLQGEMLEVEEGLIPEAIALVGLGKNPVRVVKNDLGETESIWVRWREVPDFYSSQLGDRHYTLDRQTGKIQFGDGKAGLIPPVGQQNIQLTRYQTGGGKQGNIAAHTVTQLKTAIPYVAGVINLEAAGGGTEQESLSSLKERAPKQLRHRDRAVTLDDVADLAYEASTEVARVKVLTPDLLTPNFNAINEQFWLDPNEKFESFEALLDSQGKKINDNSERDLLTQAMRDLHSQSGSVRLIILPQSVAQRPTASLALLEQIRHYIETRAEASINIMMIPPRWQEVKVTASLVPVSLDGADRISQAVLEKLDEFLHPLTGGEGNGWQFGRYPHDSDLYALLQSLPEVNYVEDLTIELAQTEDQPQMTAEDFDETTLIFSGRHNITLVSPAGGAA